MYVLNGKVVLYPDGTGVDKQESDNVLYVQDVQTGELFTIAPNRISELAEATDPQAVIAEREEAIAAAMNQEIEQEEGAEGGTTAPKPTTVPETAGVDAPQGGVSATQQQQTAPTYEIGSRFTLDLPNGSAVNGVVLQVTPDGVEVQTSSPVNGRFVQVFPTDEFDGMLSSVRDEEGDVIWSRWGAGIPVDAKTGEPVYEAVTPDVAWGAIVQEAEGDEAMAMQVVTDMVADMEAKVQKAKKAKVRAGSSVREKLEAQKKRKRQIEEAEAQLEAWKRIAAVKAERIAAAERAKIEAADAEGGTGRDKGRVGTENEGRGNKEKENDETEVIGSSMTADEALDFIADMELGAEIAPEIDLTIENWDSLFGKEGIVSTPIGNVKMGENQFTKLMRQGRNGKLGMIKPTLEHPHAIIADVSEAKEGDITERASSYVFIRSFKKVDGSRYYYFTSITVSKDGKEVVISNQEKRRNAIANLLTKGKLVWKHADDVSDASDMAQGLYSSQGNVSDLATEGTDAPQTTISSTGKDTPENRAVQTSGQENAETSSEGGISSISHAENQSAPAISLQSRGDVVSISNTTGKDTPQNSAVQTFGQENAETSLQSEVTRAEQQTNAEPTEGQKEAGNYKKGRVKVGPFDVVIEQPRGSVRSGVDANGKAWETTMQHTYGYFGGTKGVDGDAIDVFLAHDLDEWDGTTVFVVDQYNPDGSFDEHKVMLGFNSQEEAEAAYFANYEADWAKTHRTEVTAVPLADFNEWVNSSKRKTKAFAEYKVAKRNAEIDAHNAQNEQLAEQLFSMAKEAETEKDFFDRAASLFEVTGYQSDLRDIYNGVKSGEIANARALSFYTNATLKPVAVETDSNQRNANDNLQQLYTLIDTALAGGNSSVDDVKLIRSLSDEELVLAKSYKENRKGRLNKAKIDVSNIRRHILDEIQERQNRKDLAKTEKESYIKGLAYFKKNVYPGFDFENYIKNKEKEYREAVSKGRLGYAAILKGVIRAIKEVRALAEQKESANETVKAGVKESEPKQATKNSKAGEKARKHAAQPGAPAVSTQEATLRDALVDVAQQSGLEVVVDEKAQQVLDEVNGRARFNAKQKRALETASLSQREKDQPTVVSSADGANVLKKLDILATDLTEKSNRSKTFLGDLANALGASTKGSSSQYATFETINGQIVTIRLANHNASTKRMDDAGRDNAISIVISPKPNEGILNDGDAHIVEFYYNSIKLRKAEGHPLAEIVRSIKQSLYSGEYKDTTGLAEIQEVNTTFEKLREHRVFHGSGAEFDAFDHSHMGEGEGAQAYGWGTYVTEVEGIGRAYARNPWQMKINELESNISRAKEKLPFMPPSATKTELENNIKEWEEELAKLENGNKHLYTVEIPKDNGSNYLHWEEQPGKEQLSAVAEALKADGWSEAEGNHPTFTKGDNKIVLNERATGSDVYAELEESLGSQQKASEFLSAIGFTGISYPAEARSGGRTDAARNFVIFNEKDAQITDHIRFFRTPGGEAYGFTVDGKIYLDPRIATAETPIHEYAHLWADMIRNVNAEAWNDIVGLMKATPIWEEVRGLYPELKTDDEIADEVLAHYSGRRGAERLREAQQQAATETGKSVFERAAAVAAIERVKQALAKFWKSVAELFHIRFTSAEEVADRVLADMLNGVNPNKVRNSSSVNVAEFAAKHHLNQNDVKKYAYAMKSGNLGGASYAFKNIERSVFLANEDLSLGQFEKVFKPIKKELFSNFGNVEELREEHVQEALNNRNVMEAARKREEAEKEAERKRLEVFEQMSDEALDEAYMEAVRNNDEQRMRDLVNEAARRKGYQSTDEFRMSHRAPSYDEEGTDKNLIEVAHNKDNIRDSLEEQFRMNRDRNREESVAAISQAIQEIEQGKNPTVTIYRAVPKSLKEGSVRNGDWVTLSEAYAKQHGRHALNGDYRIMKENVPAANLYWDGNDINEWGYDDKRDYKYKDTRNNRKLNDLIVRDDKGAIIPLSKRFNTRKKDVRFQFVGEKGAAALDKAEEATTRLDNLGVAREMERQQKDAKAIKLATGWERGADGKWRYEVQDFDVDVSGTARRNHLNERLPWGKEYDALLDKVFDGETLTEAENARLDELMSLSEELQNTYKELETRYLDDYVKDRSLFDAYPELKQVRVEMFNDPTSGVGATLYNESKLIRINEAKLENNSLQSLLAHEVQHAIQHIEGFAMGGNSTTYREHLAGFREKYEAWSVIDEFEDKSKELGDDARPIDVYNALVREYQSLGLEFGDGFAPSREAFDKGFNLWTRGYDNEGYEDAYNEYQRLMGKFGSGEYNNRYDQLAGEVEARNVQK